MTGPGRGEGAGPGEGSGRASDAGPGRSGSGARSRQELSGLVAGAVDVYDAAARLESGGYGDAVAVRRGYRDVFDHAGALDRGDPLVPLAGAPASARPEGRTDTWARAALLLATVLLCLPVLPTAGVAAMFVAASAGWLSAQAVSAALYWGLGRRDLPRGARLALTCFVPMLLAGVVAAVVTRWWEVPVWMLAGAGAAHANTVHAHLLRSLTVLAAAVGCVLVPGTAGRVAATVVVVVLGGWALWALARAARTGRPASATGWSLVAWSLLGALALQGVLLVLLRDPHVSFPVIALAGTAAGVLGGPLLDGLVRYLHRLTEGATDWRRAHRHMVVTGLVFGAELGFLAAGFSVGVAWLFAERQVTVVEGATAFLIGALSACSGILMRVGTARGAAVTPALAAGALWLTQATATLAHDASAVALLAIALAASVVAAVRMARPGWW